MENLGERVGYLNENGFHILSIRRTYFSLISYSLILSFLVYQELYWLFTITTAFSIIDYLGCEEFIFSNSDRAVYKRYRFFFIKTGSRLCGKYDEILLHRTMKQSYSGDFPVKDIHVIEILQQGETIEIYRTSDLRLIDRIYERIKAIHSFNWEMG